MPSKPATTPPAAPPHADGCSPRTDRETSGSAIAALVLGVCGIAVLPLICSILALAFGYRARRQIDRSNGSLGGRNYATAGIVLGWVGAAIGVLLAAILVPALIEFLNFGEHNSQVWDSINWDTP